MIPISILHTKSIADTIGSNANTAILINTVMLSTHRVVESTPTMHDSGLSLDSFGQRLKTLSLLI